jgi:DNA-directed RNA polymerase specialized sigma24 family protein
VAKHEARRFGERDGGNLSRQREVELLLRIRRGDSSAVIALWRLCDHWLFATARRLGVPPGEQEQVIQDFLADLVVKLIESDVVPQSLTAYAAASFRNFLLLQRRHEQDRAALEETAFVALGATGERVITACSSDYSLRATGMMETGATGGSGAARRFVTALLGNFSGDDRLLLEYAAKHVPLREAAAVLGIEHGTARVRLLRVRARALEFAREYAAAHVQDGEEARQLFRRLGVAPKEE